MRYVSEFRDGELADRLYRAIERVAMAGRDYRLMEFCGGHTHTIARHAIAERLPPNVRLIHGPGCPVCVLPAGRLAAGIALVRCPEVVLCTYGDLMRVPVDGGETLLAARAAGADVRMVYSSADALALARALPHKQVVFFAIGFETTAPSTAVAVIEAQRQGLQNFTVYCNHVLTPAALAGIVAGDAPLAVDGYIGPGHVSAVIGAAAFEGFVAQHHRPLVITGFEPLDILQAIYMLIRQLNAGVALVENQYRRVVTWEGNRKAQALLARVFERRASFEWRGLGELPDSAWRLSRRYVTYDAEQRFELSIAHIADHKACECAAVLRGAIRPEECKVYATACTPERPLGSCMVSPEGACAARYRYARRVAAASAAESI